MKKYSLVLLICITTILTGCASNSQEKSVGFQLIPTAEPTIEQPAEFVVIATIDPAYYSDYSETEQPSDTVTTDDDDVIEIKESN